MIRCVIFDFGDTLVLTKKKVIHEHMVAYAGFLRKHGLWFSRARVLSAHETTKRKWNKFDEKSRQTSKRLWERTFLAALGVEPTKKLCDSMEKDYYNFRLRNDKLMPNAIKLLKELKRKGFRLCVVTNTKTGANYFLAKKFGLFKYFDYFLMSHKEGTVKSELTIFHKLLKKLNKNRKNKIKHNECLMVGNNLNEDTAAKQLGMKTIILKKYVQVNQNHPFFEPDYYINDLKKIIQIVEEMNKGLS